MGDPVRRAAYDEQTELLEDQKADYESPWDTVGNLPQVPPGFSLHPRPTFLAADLGSVGNSRYFLDVRAQDVARAALSLVAQSSNLSHLSRLADGELWLLDARRLPVTDADLGGLARFEGLEVLMLDETRVTDAGLEVIRGLAGLRTLSLTACPISDRGTPALASMPALCELEIDQTDVTDAGLAAFEGHPTLKVLDLRRTKVKGDGLGHLVGIPHLKELRVSGRAYRAAKSTLKGRPEVHII